MNKEEFLLLVQKSEVDIIDFKSTSYDLSEEQKQLDFVKDILSMSNSPREESALIVLGVKKFVDGTYELKGLTSHLDDSDLQTHLANRVSPIPSFTYETFLFEGKTFGIITIPVQKNGPYFPNKNYGEKLIKEKVYFRRGSKNDAAVPEEIARIYSWMGKVPSSLNDSTIDNWDNFINSVDNFDPLKKYILLTTYSNNEKLKNLSGLEYVPWTFVFDYDPESDTTGVLKQIKKNFEQRRTIHEVVLKERPSLTPDKSTYWFYARGLKGQDKTIQTGTFKDWTKVYKQEIAHQLERLAAAVNPSPVTFVVLAYDSEVTRHIQSTLETAISIFGDSLRIVIATDQTGEFSTIAAELETELINIPLYDLSAGIESHFSVETQNENTCIVPTGSGAPKTIENKDFLWLEEELELIHKNVGTRPSEKKNEGHDFLRGAEITWYELSNHWDVDRDKLEKIRRLLRGELDKRRAVLVNLFHAPGAGGTTLARRLLWDFHNEFPCTVLTHCEPTTTVERLHLLFSYTNRAILLLIDGSQIEERQVEDLFTLLRARSTPVVLFQTLRRFKPQTEKERKFYLESQLSPSDARRFADKFIMVKPERRVAIESLLTSSDMKTRTPFYFGLEAFENDFIGLESYISNKLKTLNPTQTNILCFLAIAHHYSQRPIRAQAFASLLGLPKSKSVKLLKSLPESCEDLIVESYDEAWRTAHDLLATEIIKQVLAGNGRDKRIWRQNLSLWAKSFAKFCRGDESIVSEEMLEIARRTFIYRDNSNIIGTERSATSSFAQLLDDVPSKEGRLELLRTIVELYPEEPHFWSHLGRFYSIQMHNFAEAEECAKRAIQLDDTDPLLYHMHGMILRRQINDMIESKGEISSIVDIAKKASSLFEKSRELASDDEHGYISEVQMLINVLDYAGRSHPKGVLDYLFLPTTDVFLRESVQRIEDLLEQVRRNREGEGSSSYEMTSRGKLNALYGKHDYALQIWNNLLARKDSYQPPLRRQIVWTYLARQQRSWNKLPANEVDKIIELLNENIEEDPSNEKDLRLWVQAIRFANNPPSLESIIERLGYWRANSGSLDSVYYLYVFYTLLALDGSTVARFDAERFSEESRQMARFRQNRFKSFEWLGKGVKIKRLVHQSELGEWDKTIDFWENTKNLVRVKGRIEKIEGPQSGRISVEGGLSAFFVPSRSGHIFNRSENSLVDFYLGFSYDGLRAWEVKDLSI